jgi:hypothetical protein
MAEKAKRVVKELFEAYVANPQQLPRISRYHRVEELHLVVCDYIARHDGSLRARRASKTFDPRAPVAGRPQSPTTRPPPVEGAQAKWLPRKRLQPRSQVSAIQAYRGPLA